MARVVAQAAGQALPVCLAGLASLGYLPAANADADATNANATKRRRNRINRAAELARYRSWLKDFTQDLDTPSATRRPLSDAQLDEMLAHGRAGLPAAGVSSARLSAARRHGRHLHCPNRRAACPGVLNSGIPAGQRAGVTRHGLALMSLT